MSIAATRSTSKLILLTFLSVFVFEVVGSAALKAPVSADAPRYSKVNKADRGLFEAAAKQYFNTTPSFQTADCRPENVKIKYYDGRKVPEKSNALAYTYYLNGYKKVPTEMRTSDKDRALKVAIDYRNNPKSFFPTRLEKAMPSNYCTIFWNSEPKAAGTITGQCFVFIHEYGHLIGRFHSSDQSSVMYNGYTKDSILGGQTPESLNMVEDAVATKTICPDRSALEVRADAKAKAKTDKANKKAAKKRDIAAKKAQKKANAAIKLSKGSIEGMCLEVANPHKVGSSDKYVAHNGPKDKKWRMRTCKSGAKIGLKDYKANKKTAGACYKSGRKKEVQEVCDFGRYAAIDRLNGQFGYRSVR